MSETSNSYPIVNLNSTTTEQSKFRYFDLAKRLFDILVASLGLLLLSPLFGLIALRIKRDSPGPIYFRGPRVGQAGRMFFILKFRSMYESPESYAGPSVTANDDPRITPFGKWLRDSKMNELPQLWNVLKGEMSLVGPRPEAPAFVDRWPKDARDEILSVRPGITSPASILFRDEETLLTYSKLMETYLDEIQPSKLRLDQLYVRHRSFWGDLDILFWTSLVLIPRMRSYSPPEGRLFMGPITRIMNRYINWFSIDTLITLVAIGLAGLIWRSFGPLDVGWGPAILMAFGFSFLFSTTNAILGVNRIRWSKAPALDVLDLLPGVVLATSIALLANNFIPTELLVLIYGNPLPLWLITPIFPPGMILTAACFALAGFVLVRYRIRLLTGLATRWVNWRGINTAKERVLIVGGGETGQFAAWMLNNGQYADSLHVVGFVDDDLYSHGVRIRGTKVLGGRDEIPDLVRENDIGIIIFAIHNISALERRHLLGLCTATDAQVMVFPDIPAMLSSMSRNGRYTSSPEKTGVKIQDDYDGYPLTCDLCLTKVSPLKVDKWLSRLEMQLKDGDLEGLLTQIQILRQQIRKDSAAQYYTDSSEPFSEHKDTQQ